MSERTEKIIRKIQKGAKEAGDRTLDLDRKSVEQKRKNLMKTFKQFMENVSPRNLKAGEAYGDDSYQERLHKLRRDKQKEKDLEQKSTNDRLYQERKSKGIRATNKNGQKGWIHNGKFTVGDW
jgi:hypothetical protein